MDCKNCRTNVAAIVVTYNRLHLLKNTINGLRNQSYKAFRIIVINNGSTDGTEKWLDTQNDIIVIQQDNLGGAGGFYAGMKFAIDNGYDWVWMMDDDGVPDENQLVNLINGANETNSKFVNSLVCNIDDREKLAFGTIVGGRTLLYVKDAIKYKHIPNSLNPFNGTLIHKDIIADIGFIKKEMFIWGDEIEYMNRALKAGYELYTITNALHYHPAMRTTYKSIIPFYKKKYGIILPESKQRAKIMFRNKGYLYSTYFQSKKLGFVMKYCMYYILRFDVKGLAMFLQYFNKGVNNNFTEVIR